MAKLHREIMSRASLFVILFTAASLAAAFAGFMVCRMPRRRVLDPAATAALRAPTDRARRVPPPSGSASIR
jgi:hypothetical protein